MEVFFLHEKAISVEINHTLVCVCVCLLDRERKEKCLKLTVVDGKKQISRTDAILMGTNPLFLAPYHESSVAFTVACQKHLASAHETW